MAGSSTSLWKQWFDAVDRRVGPAVNELAKSENAVTLVALVRRGRKELGGRGEHVSRRAWHLLNMPAASDVNRLLAHIAGLEREVRDLHNDQADRENTEYLASLAARRDGTAKKPRTTPPAPNTTTARAAARPKGGQLGDGSDTGGTARPISA